MTWIAYVVLTLVALAMFVPFIFSVTTSLKTNRQAAQLLTIKRLFWPESITWDAYHQVFEADILRWFGNSALVAAIWVIARPSLPAPRATHSRACSSRARTSSS